MTNPFASLCKSIKTRIFKKIRRTTLRIHSKQYMSVVRARRILSYKGWCRRVNINDFSKTNTQFLFDKARNVSRNNMGVIIK